MFVVDSLKTNLLGLPAITALGLAICTDAVDADCRDIRKQFSSVFQGNENVLREVHPLPKVDEILAQLSGATVFSKVDANSGFWQIPFAEKSQLLTTFITPFRCTTFITPFGRYCFQKMPFGISSVPEHFQKRMTQMLSGLDGVLCLMDDILVFGKDKTEHDERLTQVLRKVAATGVTLNPQKCEFGKEQLTFLGHIIDREGIRADPHKVTAITGMKPQQMCPKLCRFMGMVNQLGKFSASHADLTQPLRQLLSRKSSCIWGPDQAQAFAKVKAELSKPTVLHLYNPQAPTEVSADASSYGLGEVLMQQSDSAWKPVAYASRSMTDTERMYALIEKEALASTWACENGGCGY